MDQKTIKSPAHYTEGRKFEPKDVIRDWGLGFNLGSTVKYIARAGRKDDILQDLNKAKEFLQIEIDAIEAERAKQASPVHPNCKCASKPYTGGDDLADAIIYGLEAMLEDVMQKEALAVKPILVEVPEGVDVDEFIKQVTKRLENAVITPEDKPVEKENTEFEKKAISLYNAYLYKFDQLNKEMDNLTCEGVETHFIQDMILKKGFDSVEVLDVMKQKLMGK